MLGISTVWYGELRIYYGCTTDCYEYGTERHDRNTLNYGLVGINQVSQCLTTVYNVTIRRNKGYYDPLLTFTNQYDK